MVKLITEILKLFFRKLFFIGEGAALLNAAAGVPSLVAVESIETPHTYGFFSDQDDGNIGSVDDKKTLVLMKDSIRSIGKLSDREYDLLCQKHREIAREYSFSSIAKRMMKGFFHASNINPAVHLHRYWIFQDFFEIIIWLFKSLMGKKSAPSVRYLRK